MLQGNESLPKKYTQAYTRPDQPSPSVNPFSTELNCFFLVMNQHSKDNKMANEDEIHKNNKKKLQK